MRVSGVSLNLGVADKFLEPSVVTGRWGLRVMNVKVDWEQRVGFQTPVENSCLETLPSRATVQK